MNALLLIVAALGTLAGVAGTTFGPMLLNRQLYRQRSEERKEDWARQDRAAKDLRDRTELVAVRLEEEAAATRAQLGAIHLLVNSNLTEAERRELEARIDALEARKAVVQMKRAHGDNPTADEIDEMRIMQKRIDALTLSLDYKTVQTAKADATLGDAEVAADLGPR